MFLLNNWEHVSDEEAVIGSITDKDEREDVIYAGKIPLQRGTFQHESEVEAFWCQYLSFGKIFLWTKYFLHNSFE